MAIERWEKFTRIGQGVEIQTELSVNNFSEDGEVIININMLHRLLVEAGYERRSDG